MPQYADDQRITYRAGLPTRAPEVLEESGYSGKLVSRCCFVDVYRPLTKASSGEIGVIVPVQL
jgi:hypothetical protein